MHTQYIQHFNIYSETLDHHLLTSCHLQKHTDTECTVNAALMLHTYHEVFPLHLHREEEQVSHSSCALHTNNGLVVGTATSLVGWRRNWPQWRGATISFPVLTPTSVTQWRVRTHPHTHTPDPHTLHKHSCFIVLFKMRISTTCTSGHIKQGRVG